MQTRQITNIAIVIIAYNRLKSLERLVTSLLNADYAGDKVDLIISIDNSGSSVLAKFARSVQWTHGNLNIIEHKTRLGLKRHVLLCGEFTKAYENICILEDDLYVSPGFYSYAKSATHHFNDFEDVAGISLYSYEWNQYSNKPFSPIIDQYDTYLLQVASSWGQIWTRKKWEEFLHWLEGKDDKYLHTHLMPSTVANWSAKSWLKFHHRYLVDANKFFVYPRHSLSTNYSDNGEHASVTSTYQVALLHTAKKDYNFPPTIHGVIKYDAFFENLSLASYLGLKPEEVDINLHGTRESRKRYLLTTEALDYKVVMSFALKQRPVDVNIMLKIFGNEIFLYDMKVPTTNRMNRKEIMAKRFVYDSRNENKQETLNAAIYLYKKAFVRRLRIIFRINR